ncbi:Outer membrane protein beta-barrel domain-containing protein [Prevotella sp. KH2C16]|nr:Outer membrane protein beta-barrel domain-containing protein [Prevotella sp. KH2C16]
MAALMLSSVATFAQNAVGQFSIMPKFGMSIADLTEVDGSDARIGIVTGAELEYGVTDIFSLSAGALYSMQGCKGDNSTVKLDYINIPILANVYVTKGLAVKLGIQPGFNVNSSFKAKGVEVDDNDAKSVDFSIPVGLSYEINNFVIDGRYNWGLTKAYEHGDAKNSVFQITLGYKFHL